MYCKFRRISLAYAVSSVIQFLQMEYYFPRERRAAKPRDAKNEGVCHHTYFEEKYDNSQAS